MPLFGMREARYHMGGPPLLDQVSFLIDAGERVSLTGRNGAGKTTLLRLLLGELKPDGGDIIVTPGTRLAYLPQDFPVDLRGAVAQIVAQGAARHAAEGSWKADLEAERWVALAGLPPAADFASLSGGQKRRVLLARALASDPDALLLDEPTNHLDMESIGWMEDVLRSSRKALLFITHDRAFLRRMATRILELDRGRLLDWNCGWDTFLIRKQALLEAQEKEWAEFDRKLAQEEAWARRSPKARLARNEGRRRRLEAMRAERAGRRERQGAANLRVNEASRSGDRVVEAQGVSFAYGGKPVIRECDTTIQRGDKVAILGSNGSGKTTLIRLLLGELRPASGAVRLGSGLRALYFDQMRAHIDPEATVRDNIAGGQEFVILNGRRQHVMSYLQGFLFDPRRALDKAGALSGGERNRLLLAKLFTQPGNLLVLDEPTNDLDVETLTLLEELLVEFEGTVIVVSHDREFLDNVATSVLAIGSDGIVEEFVGGWSDWKRQVEGRRVASTVRQAHGTAGSSTDVQEVEGKTKTTPPGGHSPQEPTGKSRKLTFREAKEREALPGRIEALEAEQADLVRAMGTADFYRKPSGEIAAARARQKDLEKELEEAFTRWVELES